MLHLGAGLIWIIGAYSFSVDWKLYTGALTEVSQKYMEDTRHRCTFLPALPPGDGSTSVGGRKGTEEAGEQNGIERLQAFFFFFSPLDFLLLSIPFASYSPYWRTLTPWCLRSAKRAPDSRLLAHLPLCSPFALLHLGGAVFIDSEWQRDVGWVERSKKLKAACAQESPNICHLIRVQEGTCAKVMTFLCLLLHNGEHKGENWPSSSICLCLFNLYCWQYYIGPSFPPN